MQTRSDATERGEGTLIRWFIGWPGNREAATRALQLCGASLRRGCAPHLLATFVLACTGSAALAAAGTGASLAVAQIRESLERQFRDATGLGFDRFECGALPVPGERWELTCEAIDGEGDRFTYRIVSDGTAESPHVSMSQPVNQLDAEGLNRIAAPCEAFIDAFAQGDWRAAHAQLAPEFQADLPIERFEAMLLPLRNEFGGVVSKRAVRYNAPGPGLHQLEFAVVTGNGEATGRFRLAFVDEGNARITSFLLTAKPGSELQARLLLRQGAAAIQPLLDQPLARLQGPLADLRRIGDNAELSAVLEDGTTIALRVEQVGTAHDLDGSDYVFQILDAPTLVRGFLASGGSLPQGVTCPVRIVPDGGEVDCAATFPDGSKRRFTLARRGGEHRLRERE